MTDLIWVISSSVLIIAVLIIRAVFGKRMRSGLRCALWGLVLIRLLIPGTVFELPFSVESTATKIDAVSNIVEFENVNHYGYDEENRMVYYYRPDFPATKPMVTEENVPYERFVEIEKTIDVIRVLRIVWYSGIAVTASAFLVKNGVFYLKLRRRRKRLDIKSKLKFYRIDGISSPFLFVNSIYIDTAVANDEEKLNHVLSHELSHYRHKDHWFAFLRFAATALHWYNPLVWIASYYYRRDTDLFADDGAIRTLGESEREKYGKTLIAFADASKRESALSGAIMMTGGKAALFERIKRIAKKPKTSIICAVSALVVALAVVIIAFAGKSDEKPDDTGTETEQGTDQTPDDSIPDDADLVIVYPNYKLTFTGDSVQCEYVKNGKTVLADPVSLTDKQIRDVKAFAGYIERGHNGYENPDYAVLNKQEFGIISIYTPDDFYTVSSFTEDNSVKDFLRLANSLAHSDVGWWSLSDSYFSDDFTIDAFDDIMGYKANAYTVLHSSGWYCRTYVASENGKSFVIANSYARYSPDYDDFILDIDDDGSTELVCVCLLDSGGFDLHTCVFDREDGMINKSYIDPQKLGFEGWNNIGSTIYYNDGYDAEIGRFYVDYRKYNKDYTEFTDTRVNYYYDEIESAGAWDRTIFKPKLVIKEPEMPSSELIDQIVSDYKKRSNNDFISIRRYYGEYDGAVPVLLNGIMTFGANKKEFIAGCMFWYSDYNTIEVWKNGTFYDIRGAYEEGVLTAEQVAVISYLHANGGYIVISDPYGVDSREKIRGELIETSIIPKIVYYQPSEDLPEHNELNQDDPVVTVGPDDTAEAQPGVEPIETNYQYSEQELYDLAKSSIIVLNDELRTSIEDCFKSDRYDIQWYDIDASWERAYGDVRCYYADESTALLFWPNPTDWIMTIEIADAEFSFNNGFSLLVFHDGELIDAYDAYDKGLINDSVINIAAERHQIVQQYIKMVK
ncbi:MAG: hypothetical protein IJS45_01390 [Clostridia bacterium]|nr:hypothetical protein [Clostridia bacterium]